MKKLLRKKEVAKMFAVHHSTIMRWVVQGTFPKPKKLGRRVTVWEVDKLEKFIDES